ncbi:hypothetical protein XMG59_001611 [Marinobacterium sp. xm-g-59]|uniref:hypothetical protein n=1 Tax=Marinobacterium sp. xm-g-59 TaxID=2497748 RepID=UPI00156972C9|nr:hypothetical protein [Marinobacterium sp. xm-g-59]NRP95507.1 hypothetical protein [Marinobacterium sp. xm-g-59]
MRLGPLRILHIANFNQFKYAAWYMNLDAKLSLGFSQLGQAVDRVIHDSNIGTVFLTYRNGIYYEEGGKLRDVFSASSFEKFTTSDLNNRGLSDTDLSPKN